MSDSREYRYTVYIGATADQVWAALTNEQDSALYWGHRNVSTWSPGSRWEHRQLDCDVADVTGTVLEAEPGVLLRLTFDDPATYPSENPSVVTIRLEQGEGITRVRLHHADLPTPHDLELVSHGWPAVLSNLKTYLETGVALPQRPWEMPQ